MTASQKRMHFLKTTIFLWYKKDQTLEWEMQGSWRFLNKTVKDNILRIRFYKIYLYINDGSYVSWGEIQNWEFWGKRELGHEVMILVITVLVWSLYHCASMTFWICSGMSWLSTKQITGWRRSLLIGLQAATLLP